MSEVAKVLTRKTSLRKACKELSLADMEKLSKNIGELITEKKAEEKAQQAALKERAAKIESLKKELSNSGIEIDELMDALKGSSGPKKKTGKVQPKYQVKDADGNVHKWTGRGRTPKPFAEFFKKGGTKEQCLIK